jgi:RHS repeat-associated protein
MALTLLGRLSPDDGGEVVSTDYLPQMGVKSVTGLADYATNSRYDASGRLVHREYGFGWSGFSDYDYNTWDYYSIPDPEHPEITIPMGGRLNHVVSGDDYHTYQDNTYAYDANGNITSIVDTMTGTAQTQIFTYDEVNRLETASAVGGSQGTYSTETYLYDDLTGNLLNKGNDGLTYDPAGHPQAATAMGTDIYTYDENGNMISRDYEGENYRLTYDAESRLVKIEQVDGVTYTTIGEYVYDGDGIRVRAVVNGIGTNYVGNYYEATPGSFTKYYYAGGQRVAWRINGTPYFGFSDHLGSTSVTVDVNGEIVGNELYKAWGGERYTNGSTQTTFKYTGQRKAEAGLYFYNARWYDPEIGRFIQADTIIPEPGNPLAWDRYAYAINNPVNYTDPSGHSSEGYCEQVPMSYRSQCLSSVGVSSNLEKNTPLSVETQKQRDLHNQDSAGSNCGQYCFAMDWSYLHPDQALTGEEVSRTAEQEGWHINIPPYTSPESMVKMAQYYTHQHAGTREEHGNIYDPSRARELLDIVTRMGFPVIVDVTVDVASSTHNTSNTHFIVITGIDSKNNVYYNDPLTGEAESTIWNNLWSSWRDNKDPGGSGWYLIIY